MIDIGGDAFEKWWPLASASVDRLLRAHHVSEADRDDIVQEVAARAFIRQDEFTSLTHLTRWSCRVAANLRVDQVRKESRLSDAGVPELLEDAVDTARLVEGRVALEAVLSAVSRLSDADRVALFGEREVAEDRREAVKLAVRRHRARARLAAMVEGMIAAFGTLNRSVLRRLETPGVREAVAAGTVALVAVAIPVVGSLQQPPDATTVRQPTAPASVMFETSRPARAEPVDTSGDSPLIADATRSGESPRSADGRRPVLVVAPGGPVGGAGAEAGTVEREDPKTLCLRGFFPGGDACVDRPGPALPAPPLPE